MMDNGLGLRRFRPAWVFSLMLAFLFLSSTATAQAGDLVRGRYTASEGSRIVLELEIFKPPPYSLIVEQFLPSGIDIISSQPGAIKFNSRKGAAKWLIKKVKPGKMVFVMELSEKIGPGQIRAEVLCRDKETGAMTEIVITP